MTGKINGRFLAVDIGNTDIVLAITDFNGNLLYTYRIKSDNTKCEEEYKNTLNELFVSNKIDNINISGCMISSVVPSITNILKRSIQALVSVSPIITDIDLKSDLRLHFPNKNELGADLFACAVAGINIYNTPLVIFDLGTATTVSVINETKEFMGCLIMPGIKISSEILFLKTSLLPDISIDTDVKLIETTTKKCMSAGILYGHASMIDGLIDRIREELKKVPTVIATGGFANIIAPLCKNSIIIEENLLIKGLLKLYMDNQINNI